MTLTDVLQLAYKIFTTIVNTLERSPASFSFFIATFFAAITLRTLIEGFSSVGQSLSPILFVHYSLWYVALALSLIILFSLVTRQPVQITARVILPMFIITWLAPTIDLLIAGPGVYHIAYINVIGQLLPKYVNFFGAYDGFGVTPGIRIELILVLIGSFFYFLLKTNRFIKSVVAVLIQYTILFILMSLQTLFSAVFDSLDAEIFRSDLIMIKILALISFGLGVWVMYLHSPTRFIIILKDIRPLRLLHYQFMFLLGIVLAFHYSVFAFPANIQLLDFILMAIAITCAWLFSVITNNITDVDIDSISNPTRVTVTKQIDNNTYLTIGWCFLAVALATAALVGYQQLFLTLVFIGNYFVYSMPPLRLKRVFIFSKLFIAVNSLVLCMAGYLYITKQVTFTFPAEMLPVFLIGMTMILNFIDIKDYEGDKRAGIFTMPVVLGLRATKQVVGLSFIATYLLLYSILQDEHLLVPLLAVAMVQYYLVNKTHYQEHLILLVHLLALIPAFVYLSTF